MANDWDTDRVGGRPWRRDTLIAPFCKDDQRMYWVIPPDSQTNDLPDWHGIAGISCGNEHHARFWDDKEHAQVTDHGRRSRWAVGGIHHEKVKPKWIGIHHVIDRDWDAVRRQMVRAMHPHCADSKGGTIRAPMASPGLDELGLPGTAVVASAGGRRRAGCGAAP